MTTPDPLSKLIDRATLTLPVGASIEIIVYRGGRHVAMKYMGSEGDTSMTPGGLEAEFQAAVEACKEMAEEDREGDEDDV